jgi:hypothetical protein
VIKYTAVSQVDNYILIKYDWDLGTSWYRVFDMEGEQMFQLPKDPITFLESLIEVIIDYEEDEAFEEPSE